MNRAEADTHLSSADELVACIEASLLYAREVEAQLLSSDIPAMLGKPPPKECCGSGKCACASRFQVMVRKDDLPKASAQFQAEFAAAVEREGLVNGVTVMSAEAEGEGEPPCPACGHVAALVEGACAGCGLQLE